MIRVSRCGILVILLVFTGLSAHSQQPRLNTCDLYLVDDLSVFAASAPIGGAKSGFWFEVNSDREKIIRLFSTKKLVVKNENTKMQRGYDGEMDDVGRIPSGSLVGLFKFRNDRGFSSPYGGDPHTAILQISLKWGNDLLVLHEHREVFYDRLFTNLDKKIEQTKEHLIKNIPSCGELFERSVSFYR